MTDNNQNIQGQNTANSVTSANGVASGGAALSPWDEPLPEEPPKQRIVGSIGLTPHPTDVAAGHFELPQDHHIEEKASLQPVMQVQSVPANPQPRVDTVIPKPNIPTAAASLETAGPQASVAGVRELTLSQNNQIAPATSPVTPNQASVPPTSSVPVSPASPKPPVGAPNPTPSSIPSAPIIPLSVEKPTPPPATTVQNPPPPALAVASNATSSASMSPTLPPTPINAAPVVASSAPLPSQIQNQPQNIPAAKNLPDFLTNKQEKVQPAQTMGQVSIAPNQQIKKRGPAKAIFGIIGSLVVLFAAAVYLTETGILSVGVDRVYNKVYLEMLWGGLPADSQKALAMSFAKINSKTDYKIKGNIKLSVDTSIDSPVFDPLVSKNDQSFFGVLPAILTAASDGPTWGSDSPDSSTSSDGATTTAEPSASTSFADDAVTVADDSANSTDVENTTSTLQNLAYDLTGKIGQKGNEMILTNRQVGKGQTVEIKNSEKTLYFQSDDLKLAKNLDQKKWLSYDSPNNVDPSDGLFTMASVRSSGFTIRGSKYSSASIDGVTCFHYKIDEMELGNALKNYGISSSMVQSISGDVWIGIADKLPRKLSLKVIVAPSYALASLELDINFYDFDKTNSVVIPSAAEVSGAAALETLTEETSETVETGDAKRKSDLAKIKAALALYAVDHAGNFPISKTALNLSTEPNALATALVGDYLREMPKESNTTAGWFYSYQSADGKTFTLTTKLEDQTDPAGRLVDGYYLYFLYND